MKAIAYRQYGAPDVLHVEEVPKPSPKDDEILIRVRAVCINVGDLWARNFKAITPANFSMPTPLWLPARMYFGFTKPRVNILGNEFSGQIEAVGNKVTRFKAGDAVFGYRGQSMGAYAEYLCMGESGTVALKPANLTYEEAATLPYGGVTALNLLRKADIQAGQKILINGASGSIGAAAVQLAKHYGAEVTGVCSTPRVEFVHALGADRVIDYTREDFTQNGETYDLIFDILGKSSFERCKSSLTPQGIYLLASFKIKHLLQMFRTSRAGGRRVICTLSVDKPENLIFIKELAEAGKFKAIVDKSYALEQAADAHRYIETGGKRGAVVLTVA